MAKLVTFESVADAAEALASLGKKVTLRALRDQIGGGSLTDVSNHFAAWRLGRPLVRVSDVSMDPAITQAIAAQMQRVAEQAATAAEERAAEVEDNVLVITESLGLAEQQVAQLTTELETAVGAAAGFSEQLKEAGAQMVRMVEAHDKEATDLRQELARERMRADKAASDLARAEVRLEALPGMQSEIERLRGALESQTSARVVADQSVAVLTARLEASERRATEADARAKDAGERAEKASVIGSQIAQELTSARVQVQSQQVSLDAAAREIEASKVAAKEASAAGKKASEEAAELRGQIAQMTKALTTQKPLS